MVEASSMATLQAAGCRLQADQLAMLQLIGRAASVERSRSVERRASSVERRQLEASSMAMLQLQPCDAAACRLISMTTLQVDQHDDAAACSLVTLEYSRSVERRQHGHAWRRCRLISLQAINDNTLASWLGC